MLTARIRERFASCLPWFAAALPWLVVLGTGMPAGHDLKLEVTRVAAYAYAWSDGQRPPYWAPDLYAGYGSPIFLFYGQVLVAWSNVCALLAGSFSGGWLLALASASALATFGIQRAAASVHADENQNAARVAAYVFVLNPYVVGDALIRNAGSEYMALCAMPLAICGLFRAARPGVAGPLWLAAGAGLVIATHSLSAVVVMGLCVGALLAAYAFGARPWGQLLRVAFGLVLALLLSAYAWLPALALHTWIRSDELLVGKLDFHQNFPTFRALFDLSTFYSLGPMPLLASVATLLSLCLPKPRLDAHGRWLAALLALSSVLLLIQMPIALPLWEQLPFMAFFQFPWRFAGPLALVAALLWSGVFARWTRPWKPLQRWAAELCVLLGCLLCLWPQFAHMHSYSRDDMQHFEAWLARKSLRSLPVSSTVTDEYLPVGATRRAIARSADDAPVVDASDGFRIAIRANQPSRVELAVKADSAGQVCIARFRFPLWHVEIDGREQPSLVCAGGLLGVHVEAGKHRIVAQTVMPDFRRVGLALSLLGFLAWFELWRRARLSDAAELA